MTTSSSRDIPDMTGKTVIVTGASSGIGLAAARVLAAAGARVVFAVRNTVKGGAAADGTPGLTEVRQLDLASLDSVRAFAAHWDGPIDLLINNAGVSTPTLTRTADGFESKCGTNHLGHFALTNLLLEHVTGRVVTVASQAERLARLDFDDLNWEHRPYQPSRAYNDSKLANLLFTAELQRRLAAAGSGVLANAAHPGLVATNIYHHDGPRRPAPPGRGPRPTCCGRSRSGCSRRTPTRARGPSCTPPSPTSRATASPAPATSCTCAAPRSLSTAPPPRRIQTSHAACGRSPKI